MVAVYIAVPSQSLAISDLAVAVPDMSPTIQQPDQVESRLFDTVEDDRCDRDY
jgi:hypothetical protein